MTAPAPIALITGAGKRIGQHIARELAKAGWDIAGHYNSSEEGISKLAKEVEASGRQFVPIQSDLAHDQPVNAIVPTITANLGAPSLLINNASLFAKDEIATLDSAQFDAHMAINLKAPLMLAKAFAENIKGKGNIINITDQRVFNPGPDFFTYTLSKTGLDTATKTLAQALAPSIRVNAIAPGPVLQSIHQSPQEFEAECQATPLGHGTSLDEIVKAVHFILETPSMTGETIHLDGGQRLS